MIRLAAALVVSAALAAAQPSAAPSVSNAARDAYLYAYPLVLMEFTRSKNFPANDFAHLQKFPDENARRVIRPNADTLYSSAWLDLSKEPVVLHVPDTQGRYYLMQLMDAWTETIDVPGKRTTGTGEGYFVIVGPGSKTANLPAKARRIDCPTDMAWLLGRTQTNTAADYPAVRALQKGYTLMPLSLYPDGPKANRALPAANQQLEGGVTPPVAVARLTPEEFFNHFAQLLVNNPPHSADGPMIEKLSSLGIRAGQPFRIASVSDRQQFENGVKAAMTLLENSVNARGNPGPTGWTGGGRNVGRYGTNYTARAVVARIGLGANPPEDAVYLNCAQDADGKALDGSRHYVMHFTKSQLPPVRAFWSVTMYSQDGYFTANPLERFAIGDRDPLQYAPDGSVDLYIQHDSPGTARENNWLPAPAGPFVLSFRLYWPEQPILDGKWTPPAVRAE